MMQIVYGLLAGWILQLFGFDGLLIDGVKELFNLSITTAGYYTIFAIMGVIGWVAQVIRGKNDDF